MCFTGKIASGQVDRKAGEKLLDLVDRFEEEHKAKLGDNAGARAAALDAAMIAEREAARAADEIRDAVIVQAGVLRNFAAYNETVLTLRETPGDFGFGNKAPPMLGKDQTTLGFATRSLLARDPFEIANWNNVTELAKFLRGQAHRQFAEAIEFMRPKALGLKQETTRELDVLRALHGDTAVSAEARVVSQAWEKLQGAMADDYIGAGGRMVKRPNWRLPNPKIDYAKARALGPERYGQLVRESVDRSQMLDFDTGKPLNDTRFEQLISEHVQTVMAGGSEGLPSAAFKSSRMLSRERDFARFIVFKDADAWMRFADMTGEHSGVFDTMMAHLAGMADDTALMRVMGRNPDATKSFILDLFKREPERLMKTAEASGDAKAIAAAARANKMTEARTKLESKLFENMWAEVTGTNNAAVNTALANTMGDVRSWLSATQLGSAIISSFGDVGTAMMAARMNGLPVSNVISRATQMMGEKGSEVFAAQQGLVMDSLAHAMGRADRISGETIRTGLASKLANANIRASGLRRWSASLRGAFGLEMMAHVARERGKAFGDLDQAFRSALDRYGIDKADWDIIRAVTPHEPRPNAIFTRPADLLEAGHRAQAEKLSRLTTTEMDYAVIDQDPVTRALLLGSSQPGTAGGELRRSLAMYRSFPATFVMMHFARATARGWDGSRMGHAALSFLTMTAFGALAMQAKEIVAGRDPLSLDPTSANGVRAWGKAMLQGGGLGVFGDVLFVDQTKYGNTWAATLAGPVAGSVESVLGDFVFKNIQQAGKGQQTHFLGDAAYAIGRHMPGSSLWFARTAFQREVLDQLALMADPRTRERFARVEEQARKDWGQSYWWQPGRQAPRRAPNFDAIAGGR